MKIFLKLTLYFAGILFITSSCSESSFLDVNTDPKAASFDQVQVEYFINNSITGAQMNPHVSERAYVLYWKTAARQHRVNGSLALGGYNDGWSNDYYGSLSQWLRTANRAVSVGEEQIEEGVNFAYTSNLIQVARIWRAYLMSEFTDNFGPMPIDGFQGENPDFNDVEAVYNYMLEELRDAVSKIDLGTPIPADIHRFDKAYGFNLEKWVRYGNSMRMRLAMRLSEVDESLARSEFEDAASGMIITDADHMFAVQEGGGWDDLTGVMTREWNHFLLSATLNNLWVGLGGIPSTQQLPANLHDHVKPADYIGVQYSEHWPTTTNDPSAGFWLDGLPNSIDPRAYESFIIPGWFDNPNFNLYPSWAEWAPRETERDLVHNDDAITIESAFTWNAAALGNWGEKGANNNVAGWLGATPRLSHKFRDGSQERIFFANWETHFLLAEAAVRGWSVPLDGKTAYEEGIRANFDYWGLSQFVDEYLQSESYNRAGTSVRWEHTTEPPSSVTKHYVNGYTNEEGTYEFTYPDNHLYANGNVKNDHLTKVITQKYIAQQPYLPLEAWNDHRRLGLPFFENPAVELPITELPGLNQGNYMEVQVENFPQRIKYPSRLSNENPAGYEQAVGFLNGPDEVLTPLWWAQQP